MHISDFQAEAAKGVPAVTGAVYYGFTLNEIVGFATLFYIGLQTAYLIWKWHRESRQEPGKKRRD